jgi:flagellar protein FlbD
MGGRVTTCFPFSVNCGMIKVTRLDGKEYFLNPHQIECIEVRPDTTLVMQSGKHHIVREEVDEVLSRIETYRRRLSPPVAQE